MNKSIIIIGLMVFAVILLFPPFEYMSINNMSNFFSLAHQTPRSFEITFLPFWHNGDIFRGGDLIGTGAKIMTVLWYGLLGGMAFFIFVLGSLLKKFN